METLDRVITVLLGVLLTVVAVAGITVGAGVFDTPDFVAAADRVDLAVQDATWPWWLATVIIGIVLVPVGLKLALAQTRPGIMRAASTLTLHKDDHGATSVDAMGLEQAVSRDFVSAPGIDAAKVVVTDEPPRLALWVRVDIDHTVTMAQVGAAVEPVVQRVCRSLDLEIVAVDVLVRSQDRVSDGWDDQPRVH